MGRRALPAVTRSSAIAGVALAAALAGEGFAADPPLVIPDFRRNPPRETAPGPMPGEACERCGTVRSIREVRQSRPVSVPRVLQQDDPSSGLSSNVVGAVAVLPMGGDAGQPFVGGVGTPEMRERLSETSFDITIRLDSGGYTVVNRPDGARLRVGDRVRVEGTQLTLLAP